MFSRIAVLLCALALASAAQAQALPKPKEFYFDQDKFAAPIVVAQGEGDALVDTLMKERERGRRAREATAQLAHIAFGEGRTDLGKTLYQQALSGVASDRGVGRGISWNLGWDLYRNGETQPALETWASLVSTSVGGPSWIPPTLALSLWKLDRKSEAVQWYAAAVRTEPQLWSSPANYPRLLPDWRDEDRAVLAEVLAAWQANPPAWP